MTEGESTSWRVVRNGRWFGTGGGSDPRRGLSSGAGSDAAARAHLSVGNPRAAPWAASRPSAHGARCSPPAHSVGMRVASSAWGARRPTGEAGRHAAAARDFLLSILRMDRRHVMRQHGDRSATPTEICTSADHMCTHDVAAPCRVLLDTARRSRMSSSSQHPTLSKKL